MKTAFQHTDSQPSHITIRTLAIVGSLWFMAILAPTAAGQTQPNFELPRTPDETPAFYQEGYAQVDCSEMPKLFGSVDNDYCGLSVTKSFGWYADIELAFQVEGYVLKSQIPTN